MVSDQTADPPLPLSNTTTSTTIHQPLPILTVQELDEFFKTTEPKEPSVVGVTTVAGAQDTPKTVVQQLQCPRRPIKRLNGKQMIRLEDPAPDTTTVHSKPNKRKNPFPKRGGGRVRRGIETIHFCADCRQNAFVDENRMLSARLCLKCSVCKCI